MGFLAQGVGGASGIIGVGDDLEREGAGTLVKTALEPSDWRPVRMVFDVGRLVGSG